MKLHYESFKSIFKNDSFVNHQIDYTFIYGKVIFSHKFTSLKLLSSA